MNIPHRNRPNRVHAYCLAALGASTIALAADNGTLSVNSDKVAYDSLWERLDSDGDGLVSASEAAQLPRFADALKVADEYHDKRLSRDEFTKARAAYDEQRISNYATDSLTTARVKAALIKDSMVSALTISVETYFGQVLISGFVDNEQQVARIREIATGVTGVKQVRELLVVKS